MDWSQCLTMIGTISALTVGSTWAFYSITNERIDRMDNNHREDMKAMREDMKSMDVKWERLFEKLLLKEQKN